MVAPPIGYNLFSNFTSEVSPYYFEDFYTSFISMYSLLSFDNYPHIMIEILEEGYWYLIFFIPYLSINLFFLLPLPSAIIFQAYKE